MALKLPTVTIDDLRRFHAKHFPNVPLPVHYLHGAEPEADLEPEDYGCAYEGDGLGYYEDGVERILTDEQIAMFRHTEIQTILRERRRRLENDEPLRSTPSPSRLPEAQDMSAKREATASLDSSEQEMPMDISSDDGVVKEDSDKKPKQQWTAVSAKTRARNAKNRKKNRKNWRARKKEERKQREREVSDEDRESDEWDPWHQANGPDVQKDNTVDLDY